MRLAATSELDGPITASTWWSVTRPASAARAAGTADAVIGDRHGDRLAVDAAREVHLVDGELHRLGERRRDRGDRAGQGGELADRQRAVDGGPGRGGGRGRRPGGGRPAAAVARGGAEDQDDEQRAATPRARVACPVVAGAMAPRVPTSRHRRPGSDSVRFVPTTPRSATSARDGGIVTNRHLRRTVVGTALATALVAVPVTAGAWPGDPDGAFGSCGIRSVDAVVGSPSALRAAAGASRRQGPGRRVGERRRSRHAPRERSAGRDVRHRRLDPGRVRHRRGSL